MDPLVLATIAAIGAIAGLFAGLMGIGGGIIMAPMLLFVFEAIGMPAGQATIGALSTSLAAIFFTSIPSVCVHAYHGSVRWRVLVWLCPATMVAAILAARTALVLPPVLIVLILVLLLMATMNRLVFYREHREQAASVSLGKGKMLAIGFAAGFLGALTGTGGGLVVPPMLLRYGVPLIAAIGTGSGNTFMVALAGTVSFGGQGLNLVALLALAPSSIVMSVVGARIANRLRADILRYVYVACLILIIARLLYWIWQHVST